MSKTKTNSYSMTLFYLQKTFIYILFLSISTLCFAQQASISGLVTDEREILPYANVILEPKGLGSVTDDTGKYTFENLMAGDYTISVSYVGYETQKQAVSIGKNEKLTLDFTLEASTALEEVVVTGTMKPTFVSASPIKVDVITSKQLDTYLPTASASVVEGIQLVNGIQEVVACGVCYTNTISINGLDGAYTAVLMDGTPMYGNLASVYGLNGIPSMIIDRFEVIKGPSSTLYGSEAVAGVINIITKNPEKQPIFSADIMGTSYLESFGNMAFAPKIGKSSGYIGLNYAYVNNFDDHNQDGFGDGINMDRYSLFSKWNIHRKSGKNFSISAKYYYEDRRNGVEDFVINRNYRKLRGSNAIYGESIYTNRGEIIGSYEFNTTANLKLDFSLSHHDQDSYYGSDHYQAKQKITFSNLIWNIEKPRHDIIVGWTNRYNAYDDNTVATQEVLADGTTQNKADNQFIPGLFIQDEFEANNQWTILGGARLDHYTNHGLIFSPRLNIKYKPSDWTTLRANFGTGFRTVNLFTEDHAFITGQRTVEIVEALNPEQSYNASLNLNHVYSLMNGTGSLDIEGYYTHFTNKIIPDYGTPNKIIYENSDGFARTMGIGLTLNYRFDFPLSFNAGFNMQSATETELNAEGISTTSDIEYAPKWSGIFTANYQWEKQQMTLSYTANITGNMALPEVFDLDENGEIMSISRPTNSKPFSLHNIQLNKVFRQHLTGYVGVQNLTNYRQNTSPLVGYNDPNTAIGFSDFFDTSYAYAPNQGRRFYVGLKWDVNRKRK